jgi:hypothetical protein
VKQVRFRKTSTTYFLSFIGEKWHEIKRDTIKDMEKDRRVRIRELIQ